MSKTSKNRREAKKKALQRRNNQIKPIVLNSDEVRAVLAGEKTQYRVPLLTKKEASEGFEWDFSADGDNAICIKETDGEYQDTLLKPCPFGVIGDRLWVKERFIADPPADDDAWDDADSSSNYFMWEGCGQKLSEIPKGLRKPEYILYKSDSHEAGNYVWNSASKMPKWASRILLEITDIRIERLQDINADDAINEGCPLYGPFGEYRGSNRNRPNDPMKYKAYGTPKDAFACIWISKHGCESWASNPWVWVLEFNKVEV